MEAPLHLPPTPHRHSCESRNLSLGRGRDPAPPPPSGYPRPRARRGSTVIPAKAGIHRWDAGETPLHLPPTPHRHSCESRNPSPAPPPPSGYPRPRARRGSTVIPAKAGIHPWDAGETRPHLPPLGTRVRGHDVVPPSFLRSLSSWKRGAGIHPWDAGTTRRQHTSSYRSAQNGLSFSIKSTFHARLHLLIAFSLPMALSIDS